MTNNFFKNFKINNLYILIFFLSYFIFGIFLIQDYGISWDESAERMHGFISGNYVLEKILPEETYFKLFEGIINSRFNDLNHLEAPKLMEHGDRAYGVFFELPMALLEIVIGFDEIKNVYLFRHYVTFSIFFIGTIYFYRYLNIIFNSPSIALLGCLFLISSPRIFAESFYNSKDIIFLSIFNISNYYGINLLMKKNLNNSILFSLSIAALTSFRVIGLLVPILYLFLAIREYFLTKNINIIKIFFLTLLLFTFFLVLFWPFLWENPVGNLIYVISHFASRLQNQEMLYLGGEVISSDLPWHYLFVWIIVSNPFHITIFSISGIIIFFVNFFFKNKFLSTNYNFLKLSILLIYLIIPFSTFILLRPDIQSGWRHFFFLLPSIIVFALICINFLIREMNIKMIRNFVYFFVFVSLLHTLVWSVKNHPHQYVYFNNFIYKKKLINFFDKDYWGLSNKQLIDFIIENYKDEKIYYDHSNSSNIYLSLNNLNKIDRKRFIKKDNMPKDTKYYFYFFNNANKAPFEKQKKIMLLNNKNEIVKDIVVDGNSINTLYKIYN